MCGLLHREISGDSTEHTPGQTSKIPGLLRRQIWHRFLCNSPVGEHLSLHTDTKTQTGRLRLGRACLAKSLCSESRTKSLDCGGGCRIALYIVGYRHAHRRGGREISTRRDEGPTTSSKRHPTSTADCPFLHYPGTAAVAPRKISGLQRKHKTRKTGKSWVVGPPVRDVRRILRI